MRNGSQRWLINVEEVCMLGGSHELSNLHMPSTLRTYIIYAMEARHAPGSDDDRCRR